MSTGLDPTAPISSLSALLAALRPGTLTLQTGDVDVPVAEPVICGPDDLSGVRPGDLVLAVGVGGARETGALLRRAGVAGACAVVVASDQAPTVEVLETARAGGVVLLTVPGDVSWGRLYSLVRTVATSKNSSNAGSGVPTGDLFRLADAIAAMVGGPVTIEDPRSVVLAYSTGEEDIDEPRRRAILGRRVGDDWLRPYRDSGFFKRLWSTDEPQTIAGTDQLRARLVIAVRAGGEVLGSIWAAEAGRPFDDASRTALASAARLTALHLLRHRETEDLDRRRRAEAVTELLEHGRVDAEALSFEPDTGLKVLAVEPQSVEGADELVLLQRLGDLVALTCESAVRGAACAALRHRVYVVLPDAPGLRPQYLVPQLLDRIRAALHRPVLIGVGGRVGDAADAPRSRAEADLVLRALADDPYDRRWADIEEVRARTVLLRLGDVAAADPHLTQGPLTALVEHDQSKESAYVETLRAYLTAFGDVTVAAAALNVHPNTFRYRLRRLVEISGIQLSDPEQRLVAELQLHFLT